MDPRALHRARILSLFVWGGTATTLRNAHGKVLPVNLREPNVSAWMNSFGTLLHEVALRRLNAERLGCGGVQDELAWAGIDQQIRALAIDLEGHDHLVKRTVVVSG